MTRPLPPCLAQFGTRPERPSPPILTVEETRDWLVMHGYAQSWIAELLTPQQLLAAMERLRALPRDAR